MEEIIINQNDNQEINISSNEPQLITLTNINTQDIGINNNLNQNINIKQNDNQILYIDNNGNVIGINDVLVNGVSVVSDNIAYVIVPTKLSELENNEGFITEESDPTVPNYVKAISLNDINNWNNKQQPLVSGSNIKTINNNSILGSGNLNISTSYTAGNGINISNENIISNTITSYDELSNLPTIPSKVSDLTNDLGFVESSELSEVAFNGDYNALSNIPDIPTDTSDLINDSGFIDKNVNDLTYYTLTSNLSAVATSGSYNDLSNKPTIPTKTSDLTNDSGFIDNSVNNLTNYTLTSNLSSVATSGNYNDLSNKPTIPTVNNGTLTIQKNGTNVTTFTANQSSNTTANITVPTQISELTNDLDTGWKTATLNSGFTQSGLASAGDLMYRRIGNIVYIKGSVKGFTATSQACTQLPTGYRPATRIDFYGSESADYIGKFMVTSTGNITYLGGTRGSVTSGQWFNMCTSFITDDTFPN